MKNQESSMQIINYAKNSFSKQNIVIHYHFEISIQDANSNFGHFHFCKDTNSNFKRIQRKHFTSMGFWGFGVEMLLRINCKKPKCYQRGNACMEKI